MDPDGERRAWVALSFLAQPGDPVLGGALRSFPAEDLLSAVTGTAENGELAVTGLALDAPLARAVARWRDRLGEVPSVARLAAWQQTGLRVIIPGHTEWPSQLDDLGDARPVALWARGTADLRLTCLNSVSMVGSRAASGYGNHVALEMAATLAEHGICVISGGAYSIDASAHRGAVCEERQTGPLISKVPVWLDR
jgi:DNA processing protein